jgi:hypothetical protein
MWQEQKYTAGLLEMGIMNTERLEKMSYTLIYVAFV